MSTPNSTTSPTASPSSTASPSPSQRLIGATSQKPLYLAHPDLIDQVRSLDSNDPNKTQKYQEIADEANRRHQAKHANQNKSN